MDLCSIGRNIAGMFFNKVRVLHPRLDHRLGDAKHERNIGPDTRLEIVRSYLVATPEH